jgi:hypothetical protein
MISVALAAKLREGGLRWTPTRGDRFVVFGKGMDADVFVLSDMTIEVQRPSGGAEVIGFNGTTEWALDSVDHSEALWLPSESQLREALRGSFRRLTRLDEEWRVDFVVAGREETVSDPDPEQAYGLALLYLMTGEWANVHHPVS